MHIRVSGPGHLCGNGVSGALVACAWAAEQSVGLCVCVASRGVAPGPEGGTHGAGGKGNK